MLAFFKRYRYTLGFLLSVVIAIYLYSTGVFYTLINYLDGGSYVSAFVAGFLFPITFTAASAGLFLVELGEHYHPLTIALTGGLGAMLADLLMYRFIKGSIIDELKAIVRFLMPAHRLLGMERFTKHRMFLWGVPFLGSLLIASPLPDEIGVALYGIANFKPKYLSIVTFLLNTLGIFSLFLSVSRPEDKSLKPDSQLDPFRKFRYTSASLIC